MCEEICGQFACIPNYAIYDELKRYGIRQDELMAFCTAMQKMIPYAMEHGKAIWAVGD